MSKQASKQCCNVPMINPHVLFGVGEMLKRCFSSWFYFYLQYSMFNKTLELGIEKNDIEKNHDSEFVSAMYMIMTWSLLLYIQSVLCKHGCNVVIGWTLSQFDRDGLPQVQGIRIYSGLKAYSIHKEKSHAVHGSLPSQLLSWLCNLLCGLRVSSLSQVVIRHAKCVKQKASANPTVNAGAQRDCVDGDISVLCNYTSKPPSDWCIWFVISALLCVWMRDV